MSNYSKGMKNQLRCRKWMESQGYQVETVRYTRWLKNKDYFGLFDLVCVSEKDITFIQVKTNQKPNKEWMEKARDWKRPETAVVAFAVYKDGYGGNVPHLINIVEPRGILERF